MMVRHDWEGIEWDGRFTRKKKRFVINAVIDSGFQLYDLFRKYEGSNDPELASQAKLARDYYTVCSQAVLYLEDLWRLRPRRDLDIDRVKLGMPRCRH